MRSIFNLVKTVVGAVLVVALIVLAWILVQNVASLAFRQAVAPVVQATARPTPAPIPSLAGASSGTPVPVSMPSAYPLSSGAPTPDPVYTVDIKYTTPEPKYTP